MESKIKLQKHWMHRRAMEGLVDEGLTRAIGISNFSVAEAEALVTQARIPPAVNQCELHPLLAQRRLVGTCMRRVLPAFAPALSLS